VSHVLFFKNIDYGIKSLKKILWWWSKWFFFSKKSVFFLKFGRLKALTLQCWDALPYVIKVKGSPGSTLVQTNHQLHEYHQNQLIKIHLLLCSICYLFSPLKEQNFVQNHFKMKLKTEIQMQSLLGSYQAQKMKCLVILMFWDLIERGITMAIIFNRVTIALPLWEVAENWDQRFGVNGSITEHFHHAWWKLQASLFK